MRIKLFVLICSLITLINDCTLAQSSVGKKESSTADYIGFYQKYISGIRGQSCPMYPSCSNYALGQFKQTNFVSAFVKGADRLTRCGHDMDNYFLTISNDGIRYLDMPGAQNSPDSLIYHNPITYYSYADTLPEKDTVILFIRSLIDDAYYQQALLEIKRAQFNSKDFNEKLFINELIVLKALGEYEKAIYGYEVKCPPAFKTNPEVLYILATIYYKLENFNKAVSLTAIGLNHSSNNSQSGKLLALQGLLLAKSNNWDKAKDSFRAIPSPPYRPDLKQAYIKTANQVDFIKYKSPAKATLLSIIPGLGYAYTGHKQTAISSFILNGVLGYATYNSIKNKNYGLATLTGVFSASFYIANIYGANKSARRYNENQTKNLINQIENNVKP